MNVNNNFCNKILWKHSGKYNRKQNTNQVVAKRMGAIVFQKIYMRFNFFCVYGNVKMLVDS